MVTCDINKKICKVYLFNLLRTESKTITSTLPYVECISMYQGQRLGLESSEQLYLDKLVRCITSNLLLVNIKFILFIKTCE